MADETIFSDFDIDSRFNLVFEATVRGDPHGKGSVRVVEHEKKLLPGKTIKKRRGVQSPKSRAYENRAAQLFNLLWRGRPISGLCFVRIVSIKARPQKPHKASLPIDPDEPEGRLYCPVTPDWDNVGKSICDALKKGKVIAEDARICDGRVTTLYGSIGEKPKVLVRLYA